MRRLNFLSRPHAYTSGDMPFLQLIRQRRQPICILIELCNQLQDSCHLDIPAVLGDSQRFVCGLLKAES